MIQSIQTSFRLLRALKRNYSPILVGFFIVFSLLINYPIEIETQLDDLAGKIIDFTAIFSALLITFIISKAFQIRQEKNQLVKEAIPLANKVTHLRRICKILIDWNFFDREMKTNIDIRYPNLTILEYNDNNGKYDDIKNVISKEMETDSEDYKYYGFRQYMKFKALTLIRGFDYKKDGSPTELTLEPRIVYLEEELNLYDDRNRNKLYPLFIIDKWIKNNVTSFDISRSQSSFDIAKIPSERLEDIVNLAYMIDKKFKDEEISYKMLDQIGNEFDEFYLPQLREKMYEIEQGDDKLLTILLSSLLAIVLLGVVVPLVISAIDCTFIFKRYIIYISLSTLSIIIFYYLIALKGMIFSVINIDKKHFIRIK